MDLNGDGFKDVISGSYWPGHIFVFEGRKGGEYAAGYELTEKDGTKLHGGKPWKSERDPDMDSLASAPHFVDFDADGDQDLLIGNIAGRVILITNEGNASKMVFGKDRTALEAGQAPIKVPGGDAGPTTVDWDKDGLWDLLVGAGDGSVWFYKNVGSAKKPKFAKGRALLSKSKQGFQPLMHDENPKHHGSRSKVCAVDYNGDGLLDLLVGDFVSVKGPDPELTDAQIQERDALRKERGELARKNSKLFEKYYKTDPKRFEKEGKPIRTRMNEVYARLRKLEPTNTPSGFVWLYLQKSVAEASTGNDGNR